VQCAAGDDLKEVASRREVAFDDPHRRIGQGGAHRKEADAREAAIRMGQDVGHGAIPRRLMTKRRPV
jgi:hypothetical protein